MATDDVEQKFLAAIAANPNDREARSVYADWLDERGDVRGEYLRLEAQLQDIPNRLLELTKLIDEPWVTAVTRHCDVVLLDTGPNKIATIKVIREVTGLGLREAKDMADLAATRTAQRVREQLSSDEALQIANRFYGTGALVRVVAHGSMHPHRPPLPTHPSNPPAAFEHEFRVVIREVPREMMIQTIKIVREVTGLGLKDAKDLVDRANTGIPQTVVEGLDRGRATEVAALLRTTCAVDLQGY